MHCRRKAATFSRADAQFPSLFVLRRRYLLLQPQAEVIMQNGSVVRRNRKMHSDIWQFRWREKTPTERKSIDGDKSERSIRSQTLKQRVKQQVFLCRI